MTKRYDKLAARLVNIDNMFSSEQEAIAILQQRTKKFSPAATSTSVTISSPIKTTTPITTTTAQ
jgi:phosphoribosyl-dephospho-CoA transferase